MNQTYNLIFLAQTFEPYFNSTHFISCWFNGSVQKKNSFSMTKFYSGSGWQFRIMNYSKPVYKSTGLNVHGLTEVGFLPIFLIAYYRFLALNGNAGLDIIVGYR